MYSDQRYGTGGSPSGPETIHTSTINLTSSWQKFTITINTSTLVGKTFGTNNDDFLTLFFILQAGTGYWASALTLGAGDIEIAQVQLCAGDVALPFEPKSYADELRACQRYYFREVGVGSWSLDFYASANNAHAIGWEVSLPVPMRIIGTPSRIGDWTLTNCNQPLVYVGSSKQFVQLTTVAYAAGQVELHNGDGIGFVVDARF